MERSPLITHIAILVFKSNYKDKDGTTSKRLFFTLVYENDYLTFLKVVIFLLLSTNNFALFKKIVALGYLIQQKSHNDTRNRLP